MGPSDRANSGNDPATMELKRRCYAEVCADAAVTLIPGNYVTDRLVELLQSNGFDFDGSRYVIWEGNVMNMPLANDKQTMLQLKRHLKRFRLSFDYLSEPVVMKTTGDATLTSLVESFEAMGAPWMSGIDDIQGLAGELGVRVFEKLYDSRTVSKVSWSSELLTSLPALLGLHPRRIGQLRDRRLPSEFEESKEIRSSNLPDFV